MLSMSCPFPPGPSMQSVIWIKMINMLSGKSDLIIGPSHSQLVFIGVLIIIQIGEVELADYNFGHEQ